MKPRIVSLEHANKYPDRFVVIGVGRHCWSVYRGYEFHGEFPTHAEAIAEADRLAHPTPPNLSAHGARLMDDAARAFREGR